MSACICRRRQQCGHGFLDKTADYNIYMLGLLGQEYKFPDADAYCQVTTQQQGAVML